MSRSLAKQSKRTDSPCSEHMFICYLLLGNMKSSALSCSTYTRSTDFRGDSCSGTAHNININGSLARSTFTVMLTHAVSAVLVVLSGLSVIMARGYIDRI